MVARARAGWALAVLRVFFFVYSVDLALKDVPLGAYYIIHKKMHHHIPTYNDINILHNLIICQNHYRKKPGKTASNAQLCPRCQRLVPILCSNQLTVLCMCMHVWAC